MGFLRYNLVVMPSMQAGAGSFALTGQTANLKFSAGAIAGHNGGRSQTNFSYIYAGDYPFINAMKIASAGIYVNFVDAASVTPDTVDTDGYPTVIAHGGMYWSVPLVPQAERPGNYIVTWDGTATVSTGGGGSPLGTVTFTGSITGTTMTISGLAGGPIQPGQRVVGGTVLPYTFIMSGSGTTWTVSKSQSATGLTGANGGSFTSSGGAGAGYTAFTVVGNSCVFQVTAIGSPRMTNLQIYHVDDAARVVAGETFNATFKNRIIEANFGVLRFLNWQDGNLTNLTTWRTRKPITHINYTGDQLNNSFYAGTAAHTSNNYVTSQRPAIHSSDGTAWTSGGPKDKDTVHVLYTNSATTSGLCSLSIAGSAPVNIINPYCGALADDPSGIFYPRGGFVGSLATLIYDVGLGWIQHGGNTDQNAAGLHGVVPPEICVQLCKEVGAHPFFISPPYALDTATDYMAELAQYCKTYATANAPWMIPRFEPSNETWNFGGGFYQTGWADAKGKKNWPGGGPPATFQDQYGKALANLGQMCAAIYGAGNLGNTYQVLCGVQTAGIPSQSDEKLESTLYINQTAAADPAITGSFGTITFTKQAAKLTTSHVTNSQYISPSGRFLISELIDGFAYSVTNKGNTAAQTALADAYCDGLLGAITPYNLAYNNDKWVSFKAWADAKGVHKMCGYEGCWSPDYLSVYAGFPERASWDSSPTGRTQSTPTTIIQLAATCRNREGGGIVGNPGVVGMGVIFLATGTAFDNPSFQAVTFTGGGSANITGANSLRLNQSVYFRGDSLPTELATKLVLVQSEALPEHVHSELYYVVQTGNPFRISATRGGTAITFNSVGSNVYALECWRITAVDSANNRVTIDVDSTGFTTPTGGFMSYVHSQLHSNNLRYAGKMSSHLQGYIYGGSPSSYQMYLNAGGEFPSNYLMGGGPMPSGNVWFILEPLTTPTVPPQWAAIIAFNH